MLAFWDATPRELGAALAGEARRLEAARDIAVIGGWVAAVEARLEKIHKLDELLGLFRPKEPSKPMTNEQIATAWSMFAATSPGMVTHSFEPFDFDADEEETPP